MNVVLHLQIAVALSVLYSIIFLCIFSLNEKFTGDPNKFLFIFPLHLRFFENKINMLIL